MSKNNENNLVQNLFPQEGEMVPRLRFPEFGKTAEWELTHIGSILNAESSSLALNKLDLKKSGYAVYGADGIIGYIDTFQHKSQYISIVKDGSGVGRLNLCEGETSTLGTLAALKSKNDKKYQTEWVYYLLNTIDFFSYVKGSGIPHIYYSDYKSQKIGVPKPNEQQKIAACLSSLDEVITAESQKLELLKEHKKGLLQNLFPNSLNRDLYDEKINMIDDIKNQGNPKIKKIKGSDNVPKLRFKEFKDIWSPEQLSNLLDYERPDNYIVKDTNYVTEGTPVLTANKSFILGYTQETFGICNDIPAIIFDDFTVDKKFVDFPFKVKSSAIKILRPKGKDDLKFLFELMSLIKFESKEHKRYYISAYQNLSVPIPKPNEQQKIASCLSSLDDLIIAQNQKLEALQLHKKGLLQGLFPNSLNRDLYDEKINMIDDIKNQGNPKIKGSDK